MLHSHRLHILGSDAPSPAARAENRPFGGWEMRLLEQCLEKAGIPQDRVSYSNLNANTLNELNKIPGLQVIVCLGSRALKFVSGYKSLDKYQLSPLDTLPGFDCPKCIGSFTPKQITMQYNNRVFLVKALSRAWEGCSYAGKWERKEITYHYNNTFQESLELLDIAKNKSVLGIDIETGAGIINTFGFAWSATEGVAINTLPEKYSSEEYHLLWNKIAHVLEKPSIDKILQNNIYEAMYFSKYGIYLKNIHHDTMWAQRVLWPEFKVGLGNVARFYTNEIYWKDDGKVESSKERKDWNNIKDWDAHFKYNVKDTTGTFEAYLGQREDIFDRGIDKFFYGYVMKLADPIVEMCSRGLPVDEQKRQEIQDSTVAEIEDVKKSLSQELNHRSFKQKQELFIGKGYKLPQKRCPKTKVYRDSVDELSMKKLRLKYPEDTDIKALLRLAKLEKSLSSYINFDYDDDAHVRFSLIGTGTETLRFSSGTDPWGKGFNAQTIPKKSKVLFKAPEGFVWMNVDLSQAESRYVAYATGDTTLIEMLENPDKDIHRFVAGNIFDIAPDEVSFEQRQLGKKSGHGANYSMAATTFMESCLKEMDLVISRKEASHILETYHKLFPGIRMGHGETRARIKELGYLENPFGYRRYFYGRHDDNTFREAYAFEPQSTIPMITNHLMLHLLNQRTEGNLDFRLHLQVHDSLVLLCPKGKEFALMDECLNTDRWHPHIELKAGKLVIPTECETGPNLADMTTYIHN